jgi:hypothetical protein
LIYNDEFIFEGKGDYQFIFSVFGETNTKRVLIAPEHSEIMEKGQTEPNQYHMRKRALRNHTQP